MLSDKNKILQHFTNLDGTYYGSRWFDPRKQRYGEFFNIYKTKRRDKVCIVESYENRIDKVEYMKNFGVLGKMKHVEIPVSFFNVGPIENKKKKVKTVNSVSPNNIRSFSTVPANDIYPKIKITDYVNNGIHSKTDKFAFMDISTTLGTVRWVPKINRPAAYRYSIDISSQDFDSNSLYCYMSENDILAKLSYEIQRINKNGKKYGSESGEKRSNSLAYFCKKLAAYSVILYYINSSHYGWRLEDISSDFCWRLASRIICTVDAVDYIAIDFNYLRYKFDKALENICSTGLKSWLKTNVNSYCLTKKEVNYFPENFSSSQRRSFNDSFPVQKRIERKNRNQQVIDMYLDGKKQIDIASEMNMSYIQVKRIIKEYRMNNNSTDAIFPIECRQKMILFSQKEYKMNNNSTDAIFPIECRQKMITFSQEKSPEKPKLSLKVNLGSGIDFDLNFGSGFNVSEPVKQPEINKKTNKTNIANGLW